jgi:hypothetical protein
MISPWLKWVEPWCLAYALLGATAVGLVFYTTAGEWIARRWGYSGATVLAMGGVSLGLIQNLSQHFDSDKRSMR